MPPPLHRITQIAEIERRLRAWQREDKSCRAIAAVPGVGPLTATAAVATMGDVKTFRSGREFAAWIGLVPRQTGTGGKVQLPGIKLQPILSRSEHTKNRRKREAFI
ncbi:hypothetical protein BvRS1_38510 [Burkholderia vietnamiensis]|nr:hypothetical protein BvRS1_38510 [Burkholderia vietnamiensis]